MRATRKQLDQLMRSAKAGVEEGGIFQLTLKELKGGDFVLSMEDKRKQERVEVARGSLRDVFMALRGHVKMRKATKRVMQQKVCRAVGVTPAA